MKIAIIESKLDGMGGSQRQALCLAYALQNMGADVTVYALACNKDRCFTDILDKLKVVHLSSGYQKIKPIKIFGHLNYFRRSAMESRTAKELAFLIDPDTDVLNAHDRLGFRVAAYAKKRIGRIPSVLMMNDILTKSWIRWRRAQFNKEYTPRLKHKLFNWLVDVYEVRKFILPHEKIVVLDNRTKQWVYEYFGKDAAVVRSGVDVEKFPYRERNFNPQEKVKIFMAGIFFIHRRYEDAIRALAILRNKGYEISLTIAGSYGTNQEYIDYHQNLVDLVRECGLEKCVTFPGKISDKELIDAYQQNDIYISTNHLQSWGLAAFEAMACGCPVIISNTAGASEVLTDGENALIVSAKSPEAIAASLERLINDTPLYQSLSIKGRSFVERNISWEKYAEGMLNVFEGAIKQVRA